MVYVLSDIYGNERQIRSVMDQIQLQPSDMRYILSDGTFMFGHTPIKHDQDCEPMEI